MDQYGNNLNRYYLNPDQRIHPSIFAAKSVIDFYAKEGRLSMYLDLHSHASKRGCFIYGNVMDTVLEQTQNQLYCYLIALNSPHFDYSSCLFSREHMTRIDPGDMKKGLTAEGSGRVATYLSHGIIHSYTLECNYNTSRANNDVPAPVIDPAGDIADYPVSVTSTSPAEKYTPASYENVGRACIIAMLDIRDINPCSRIPNSRHQSLDKMRSVVGKEVGLRKEYRLARMKQRSVSAAPRQKKRQVVTDDFSAIPWRRCVSAIPSRSSPKWGTCDEVSTETDSDVAVTVSSTPSASLESGSSALLPPAQTTDMFLVYDTTANVQPASPSKSSPTILKSKPPRDRSQITASSELEIRGGSLFRVQPAVSNGSSPTRASLAPSHSITYTDTLSKDIDDIILKTSDLMAPKKADLSKLPIEVPPSTPFDAISNNRRLPFSSSSKLSQAAKSVLKYDSSHTSSGSTSVVSRSFVNHSPSDGGRNLSTMIISGVTEDVSRFTQPC